MAKARAQVGQRWLVRKVGLRIIVSIKSGKESDEHGRLYGIRHGARLWALTPVSSYPANWGRFVRSRDLIRRDCRVRPAVPTFERGPQD